MSGLKDLSKAIEPEPNCIQEKETLLAKYEIPVGHFEFDYIDKCKDGKEMEKIYHVLLSGEEGDYPQLLKAAEDRLRLLKPKSRWLRKSSAVIDKSSLDKNELQELSQDLESWLSSISKHSKELDTRKTDVVGSDASIRTCKSMVEETKKQKEKRISSTNYSAWDKYDPDTEILKMELEEEKERNAVMDEKKDENKDENKDEKKEKPKKTVTFNKFATEAEAVYISNREREKGNEFFKAGDYEEALTCYENSILSKPCVDNLNNRAATYLKLKKYDLALKDCNKVLTIEKDNVKALLRKSDALENLKRYNESLECAESVIRKCPNNNSAQELAERVRKHCEGNLTNTRMKIIEIE